MEETLNDGLKDFKEYLERYCRKHKKTTEEALADAVVVDVGKYYGVTDSDITHSFLNRKSSDMGLM